MARWIRASMGWVLGWWALGGPTLWADGIVKTIPSDCAARLLEELRQERPSAECGLLPAVVFTQDRYALLDIHVRCASPGTRGPEIAYRKGCHVVLDTENYTIVGESLSERQLRPIGLLEVDGQPIILVERTRQWVLVKPDGNEAVPYVWECPEEKCLGPMSHQARLIDRGVFPEGPLRVAVVRPDDPFLLHIYDLHPAPEGRPRGAVSQVDRLVSRSDWSQTWLRTTNLEEEMRHIYFSRSVWQKLRDWLLDIDLEAELKKAVQHQVEGAPRGMTMFYHPEQGFFLATQRPLTLTHVDPRSRSFQVRPPRGLGPLQPISLASSLSLTGLFPDGRDAVWGFVQGAVLETETQYVLRHPGSSSCRWRWTLPNGLVSCVSFVDLLVRIPLETLKMAEWWVLHERDGSTDDKVLMVLRVDGDGVEYLETTPGRSESSASIVVKRKFFR